MLVIYILIFLKLDVDEIIQISIPDSWFTA